MSDTSTMTDAEFEASASAPAEASAPVKQTGKVKSGGERRPRGWLETDIKRITDKFVQGEITLEEGQHLTPHRLAKLVQSEGSLTEAPSTGACAAVLNRWRTYGFASLNEKPLAFVDYTDEGRDQGLTALKAKRSDDRKAARAAAKASKTDAAESTEG